MPSTRTEIARRAADRRAGRRADIGTVCEAAFEWAGEYGFSPSTNEHAREVWAAAKRIRPDLEPKRG